AGEAGARPPGPAQGRHSHCEEQSGNAEEDVHHAIDDVVPRASRETRTETEAAADQHRRADGHYGHGEGDARSVDDAAQDVAAQPVRSEPGLVARGRLDQVEVGLVGRMRGDHGCEHSDSYHEQRDDDTRRHYSAARQAAYTPAPADAALRPLRRGSDRVAHGGPDTRNALSIIGWNLAHSGAAPA